MPDAPLRQLDEKLEGFDGSSSPRPRTLPQQIADDLARDILQGRVQSGQRVGEAEMASRYGTSRGPIRDAIRELEKLGLVDIFPRRGAFVAKIDNNAICDMFNVMAHLMGLAARYCALVASAEGLAEIDQRISAIESLSNEPDCDPVSFALASGRAGAALGRICGSVVLGRSLADAMNQTFWYLIFREHALDYLSIERRQAVAVHWRAISDFIHGSDALAAERSARELLYENRNETLKRLSIPGSAPLDEKLLIG